MSEFEDALQEAASLERTGQDRRRVRMRGFAGRDEQGQEALARALGDEEIGLGIRRRGPAFVRGQTVDDGPERRGSVHRHGTAESSTLSAGP